MTLRLFFRQPFTQNSSPNIINKVNNLINKYSRHVVKVNPYMCVSNKNSFKKDFEKVTNIPFTPENFRNYRLDKIRQSHASLIIRTAMSESTAFELGYMYSKFPNMPMLIAVQKNTPITTTLLQDLHPDVKYVHFNEIAEIKDDLYNFFDNIGQINNLPFQEFP